MTEDIHTRIRKRLNILLKDEGISKNALSKKIGVSHTTIADWLQPNGGNPRAEVLDTIAETYGVSVDWLLGRTEEKHIREQKEYLPTTYGYALELIGELYHKGIVNAYYDNALDECNGEEPQIMVVKDVILMCALIKLFYYEKNMSPENYERNRKQDVMDIIKDKEILHMDRNKMIDIYNQFIKEHNCSSPINVNLDELLKALEQ